jgi:deoxyribonuclease-4
MTLPVSEGAPGPEALRLGAHVSVAGGLPRAFERADRDGCEALQIFTQSGRAWASAPRDLGEIREFSAEAGRRRVPILAHDSYLINLASGEPELAARSRSAFLAELERCEALGVGAVVLHPGAHRGDGLEVGLPRVSGALRWALDRTAGYRVSVLLELTAGQGTALGSSFAELRWLLDDIGVPDRTGVCVDTCHAWAAGYDLQSPDGYEAVWRELDRVLGLATVRAFHLNDSRRERGARVDRHAAIGEGHLGAAPFERIVRDPRFAGLPAVLELPDADVTRGLRRLRRARTQAHTEGCAGDQAPDAHRR